MKNRPKCTALSKPKGEEILEKAEEGRRRAARIAKAMRMENL